MAILPEVLINDIVRLLLVFVFVTAIFIIKTRTLLSLVKLIRVQSFLIVLIAIMLYFEDQRPQLLQIIILAFFSRVVGIPYGVTRISKRLKIQRETKVDYLSTTNALFLSLGIILLSYQLLSPDFSGFHEHRKAMGAVAGVSLSFIGLIIIFSRNLMISDIIGYLTMENGVLLIILTVAELPFFVEVLIIIDLFIFSLLGAVFALGIDSTIEEFHRNLTLRNILSRQQSKESK